jgi:hypothetical protein
MEELIDKYFEKTLSSEEEKIFEERLKSSSEFKTEVAFQEALRDAIHAKERKNLKGMLQGFDNKQNAKPLQIDSQKTKWYYAVAAAAVAMVVGLYFYNVSPKNQNASLFDTYYETYPNVVAPNVRGENAAELRNRALLAYDAENYKEAIELFKKVEGEEYATFYEALSKLALGDAKETIEILKNESFQNSPYPLETYRKWYLALAYLKLNDLEACKTELKTISDTENPQRQKALELLEKL